MNAKLINKKDVVFMFKNGELTTATLISNPMGKGFALRFLAKNNDIYLLKSRRADYQIFETAVGAERFIKSVGFKSLNYDLESKDSLAC
jgi:hypothetical protein